MKKILFTLALLLSLTVQAQDKTTMEQNMQEVQNYLKECGVFYIATVVVSCTVMLTAVTSCST